MGNDALQQALDKVWRGPDIGVEAPEWSNQGDLHLGARTLIAVLLFAFASAIVWNAGNELPGESGQDKRSETLAQRATDASEAAATASADRIAAARELVRARTAWQRARQARTQAGQVPATGARVDLPQARVEWVTARLQANLTRSDHRRRVAEQSAAYDDLLAVRSSSDVDLVRAIGLGILALVALLGAGALLAPRRSQVLSVRRLYPPPVPTTPDPPDGVPQPQDPGTGTPGSGTPGTGTGAAPTPPVTPQPATNLSRSEPAMTQGFLASAALIAGLFGIQHFEGLAENLLNIAIPVVPILGGLFARSRVVAQPNLSAAESARLFGRA